MEGIAATNAARSFKIASLFEELFFYFEVRFCFEDCGF